MIKNNDAQIYILTHRKTNIEENSLYTPLQIGVEYTKQDIYQLKDNQFKDNISSVNPLYCDVCGTYYIYKNLLKEKYVGVCGVRRYLDIKENEDFDSIFNKYDIIINNPLFILPNIKEHYYKHHNRNDIDHVTDIINIYYPEYLNDWNNLKLLYSCNCYLTKKEIFKDYCDFLFDILFKLFNLLNINDIADAKKYVLESYDKGLFINPSFNTKKEMLDYQLNIGGFLQERILSLYIVHNKLKTLNRNIIFTENYLTFVNYEKN